MNDFDYFAPQRLDDALQLMAEHAGQGRWLAGGTDLVPRLRNGTVRPACLIDLRCLPLGAIELEDGHIHLGARVTHAQAARSSLLARTLPALQQACLQVGGPPVRNRGTLGGNIANASPAADRGTALDRRRRARAAGQRCRNTIHAACRLLLRARPHHPGAG